MNISASKPFEKLPAVSGRPKSPLTNALATLKNGHYIEVTFDTTAQRKTMSTTLAHFNRKNPDLLIKARTVNDNTVRFYRVR